jgi:hypothetical protein
MKPDHITTAKILALGTALALADARRSLAAGRAALDRLAATLGVRR